ncbi:MAG: hypothetical protein HYT16_01340 [DPANN group archaeon]|nr:hypothetical protein [DPANN group archaeon]
MAGKIKFAQADCHSLRPAKRRLAWVLLFAALIAVSGCVGQQQLQAEGFAGGTEGLKMEFLNNTPPDKVFKDIPFEIALFVENVGEKALQPGEVELNFGNANNFGIASEQVIRHVPTEAEGQLENKYRVGNQLVGGGRTVIYYDAKYTGILPPTEKAPVSFSIQACYPYETKGISKLCIAKGDGVCDPLAPREIKSSGAPVQFTEFSELATVSGDEITVRFDFRLENTGGGQALSTECRGRGKLGVGEVVVHSLQFGTEDLLPTCKTANKLAAGDNWVISFDKDGVGKGTCTFNKKITGGDYQDLVFVDIVYSYEQQTDKQISVIPVQL